MAEWLFQVPSWLQGWAVGLGIPLLVLLLVSSALIERSGPIRLRHWAEEAGGKLRLLYGAPRQLETFRLWIALAARLAPLLLWAALSGFLRGAVTRPLLVAGVAVALVVTATELLNRFLVELYAEASLRRLTPLYVALRWLLLPAIFFASWLVPDSRDADEEPEDEVSEDELEAFIDVGRREGILEKGEGELLQSIVDFGDTQAKSVMTPRVEIVCAPLGSSIEQLAELFFESKHSRLPLYRDAIDQIVGVLHIRDLFEASRRSEAEFDAAPLTKSPHFVPESKPLDDLLRELQSRSLQMAIVVDEYGGVAGLVTVEDLLEEIVGEINDEHEKELVEPQALDGGGWRLEGRTDLDQIEPLCGVDLSELPYETVSGLVCGELGFVPKSGASFTTHGLRFSVEEADQRRVTLLTVRQHEPVTASGRPESE